MKTLFDLSRSPMITVITAIFLSLSDGHSASAYTYHKLHTFCSFTDCDDGSTPNGLLPDGAGNYYGTTQQDGDGGDGNVYELVPNSAGGYDEIVIYSFICTPQCNDGAVPVGDPILDTAGNLYGATQYGGSADRGLIYKLTHKTTGWTFHILHSFCALGCANGSLPAGGLAYAGQQNGARWDGTSPLFGATTYGGVGGGNGNGVVFQLTHTSSWVYKPIHRFSSGMAGQPVAVGAGGVIYGTTVGGGKYGFGALYKLTPNGSSWKETTLHNFCNTVHCLDGATPSGRLLIDSAGDLYGVTTYGGSPLCEHGCGNAFEYAHGKYNVIHSFSQSDDGDGSLPQAALTADAFGHLFGTTVEGGAHAGGTVFTLTNSGGTWSEQILYSFCSEQYCPDGLLPDTPVIPDSAGNLFGTTSINDGNIGDGTIFELTP